MVRPRRLYATEDNKFYYLIDGKKRFIKQAPPEIARINIKNVVNAPQQRRVKRRRKKIRPTFGGPINSLLARRIENGLPTYFYNPKKEILAIEDIVKGTTDTSVDKLAKLLLKGTKAVPSSSKIQPTITAEETPKRKLGRVDEEPAEIVSKQTFTNLGAEQRGTKGPVVGETGLRAITESSTETSPEPMMNKPQSAFRPVPLRPSDQKPVYSKPSRQQYQDYLKKNESGLMASLRNPKNKETPASFSASTKGTEDVPGIPKSDAEKAREEARKFIGEGNGLYNTEIEKIVKKRIKDFVPVIASDEVESLIRYVGRGDKRFGFVMNTNPSDSDGSGNDGHRVGHWLAIYINNEDDYKTIEYFDPLAEGKMPEDLIKMCRRIAMKMNPEMMFKYKQNMLRRQSKLTSNCGHHAIKFLEDRFNAIPWSVATGYDDYMEKHSSAPDDSHDGEKDITKVMKQYESYI